MTRKKVKLAYITNDSARKATFKKRKKGLLKKVSELTTLCDVEACAIIYSPYEAAPEVYPSPLGAQRVLGRFRKMPEMDQSKKMVNQEGFLRQRIAKANDQLKKLRKDNRDKEISRVMFRALTSPAASRALQGLSILDLSELSTLVDRTLADVEARLDKISAAKGKAPKVEIPREEAATEEEEDSKAAVVPAPLKKRGPRGPLAAAEEENKKPQWFMELMMMNHHEDHIMNFGGDVGAAGSSAQWGNNRVFP